jgi:hypothetical protein
LLLTRKLLNQWFLLNLCLISWKKWQKKYSVHSTYVDEDERAAGGSTIIMRDNILHNSVNLNSYLHAVAFDKNTTSSWWIFHEKWRREEFDQQL